MKNNSGLTALDIINPNAGIAQQLNLLLQKGVIGQECLAEAEAHFGLKRGKAGWLLFFKRIFALLGVALGVCGLIFFMAWNWEDMHRLAKFATLQAVFVIFSAYCVLRWQGAGGAVRWDARVALFGASLMVGGMLALYGQVYQTGADPWELFRAWTIMLLVLALPGRATVFWFMVWLCGTLWFALYLGARMDILLRYGHNQLFILYIALSQFAMLAVNESAGNILNKLGISHDRGRWLSRTIGASAIALMACFAVGYLALRPHWLGASSTFGALYPLSLLLVFFVYYKLIPELLFLSLSVFSLSTFIALKIGHSLLKNFSFDLGNILILGLVILALAFGSLKLILLLGKGIRERARQVQASAPHGHAASHSLGIFKSREEKKAELKSWLLAHGAATAEDIEACYAQDEINQNLESPWYAKFFVCIGVWVGSAAALGAFTGLVFMGLSDPAPLGLLGLILCGASIHLGTGKKLALRAFSQVLGVCGLIYAMLLFDFDEKATSFLIMLLLALFWLLKPPFASRLGAFTGALVCLFLFLNTLSPSADYYTGALGTSWHVKSAIYCLGLLWSVHYLVVMNGRPPKKWKEPAGGWLRLHVSPAEILGSSAYACLIFFAGLVILLPQATRGLDLFQLDSRLGTALVFAALTGLMAWRYPAARKAALLLGPLLAAGGWFAPYLALGFGLLLLAFHTGRNAFLGAAVAYLGCATWMYYYNLELTLLYKSLVLMASGLIFLLLSLALSRLTVREVLR